MQIAELNQGFTIKSWVIEPKLNRISMKCDNDVTEHIVTPKVMALCLLLAKKQGEPVSQQEMADVLWPNLAISDSSIYQAVAQLRKALNDNESPKQFIERVSGKGYRLIPEITPINSDKVHDKYSDKNKADVEHPPQTGNLLKRILGSLFILFTLASIGFLISKNIPSTSPPDLSNPVTLVNISSIAIRPTKNLTQPRQDQLDTFSHLLLSDLLTIPKINLILIRNEGQISDSDVELTHSIRSHNGGLLLSAQLITKQNTQLLWAKDFWSESSILIELKDQVTDAIRALLNRQELQSGQSGKLNEEQYESFVLAQYLWNKREPSPLLEAQRLFEVILQRQPNNIDTLVGLCNTYLFLHVYSDWTEQQAYDTCAPLISKANKLAPYNGKVLATRALLLPEEQPEMTNTLFEQAIAQAPNYAQAYLWYGNALRTQGHVEKALLVHQKALTLDPLSPNVNRSLAYSLLNLRRVDEARRYYQRALSIEPRYSLRPVEELDFLPLNIERAKQFIAWSNNNASNLAKRSPYLLTQALVRLGLGQTSQARILVEQATPSQVNKAFLLYVKAALSIAENDPMQAAQLLEERYFIGLKEENTSRYVMPYVTTLTHLKQFDKAYRLFTKYFPEIRLDGEITEKNIGQFIFLNTLLIHNKMIVKNKKLAIKIQSYFENSLEQELDLPYVQWLVQSDQNQIAKNTIEQLIEDGWLPDFNDNIVAEINMCNAYIKAGGDMNAFNLLLENNRDFSTKKH